MATRTINFYKEGNLWIINKTITPAGSYRMKNNGDDHVSIIDFEGKIIFSGYTTEILDSSGNGYSDYESLISAVSDFFVKASGGGGVEIVNDLTTGGTTKALSAEQGKILQNSKMNLLQNGTTYVDTTILRTLVGLGFDLSYANFEGFDLSNAQLGAAYRGYYVGNANLSHSNLSHSNLSGADLTNANLSGAYLSYANLPYANLSYAYLSNANLPYANLSGAYLEGANLSGAYLSYANFSNANLSNVTGLNSDINTALAIINKDPQYDGLPWTLTWTDGVTYQCDPATGLFTIQN